MKLTHSGPWIDQRDWNMKRFVIRFVHAETRGNILVVLATSTHLLPCVKMGSKHKKHDGKVDVDCRQIAQSGVLNLYADVHEFKSQLDQQLGF